ncbi:MAG: sugar ABC transporter ATP-binding protein [Terriglobia bacterium]
MEKGNVEPPLRLEMIGITKSFPGVRALDEAHLAVRPGECHALVGENGAGKSTLMKILAGAYHPDSGQIRLEGVVQRIDSPVTARELGISMIHQELNLLPEMTVAENIYLGHELRRKYFGWLDHRQMEFGAQQLLGSFGQSISGKTPLKKISLGQQQMVEIAKAISVKSKVIIMDEPSAILTDRELVELFRLITRLKQQGVAVIYISHRLEEIDQICDRVTIMRDGKTIHTAPTNQISTDEMIRLMVGREIEQFFPSAQLSPGDEILRLDGISKKGKLQDIHLSLRKGEIVGLTGLVGAGRSELARIIFGADQPDGGQIYFEGQPVRWSSPREAIDAGIGFLTEDRKSEGLVLNRTVRENTTLAKLSRMVRRGCLNLREEKMFVQEYIKDLSMKSHSTEQIVKDLSGGTQQKVVLAKWLFAQCKLLIFDEPTRGIDVGAKSEIYQLLCRLVAQGIAILLISSELPEVLRMCNRILVMHEGEITGELKQEEADQEKIMALAMGIQQPAG